MSHKIKAWVSLGITISMMILLLSPLQREVAAKENTEKASEENFISMDAFCALNPEEQNDQLVDIASVDDLDKLRTYLSENPTGGANTFRQTADIVVSPYTYEYLEDAHRIKISYDGAVEAYYDVTAEKYYASEDKTGDPIDYQWRVASWVPLGKCFEDPKESTWSYEGGNHTIEGVYQEIDIDTPLDTSTTIWEYYSGIFWYASRVSGVTVKNFFGKDARSALGGHLGAVRDCKGESVQLMALGYITGGGGFISEPEGNIENVQVDINIFSRERGDDADTAPRVPSCADCIGGIVDRLSISSSSCTIRDCQSSGLIWNVNCVGFAYGGIVGNASASERVEVLHCSSDMQIEGMADYVGGIVGCYGAGKIEPETGIEKGQARIVDCTYEGETYMRWPSGRKYIGDGFYGTIPSNGGICGSTSDNSMVFGCRNRAKIRSAAGYAGGIVGCLSTSGIVSCVNEGEVITECGLVKKWQESAGGIVGSYVYDKEREYTDGGLIVNCYNAGDICSYNSVASGIIGMVNTESKMPKQTAMEIQNVCSIGASQGAVEKDYLTGIITEGVSRAYDGRTENPAKLCKQLEQSLLGKNVTGGYEWDDLDSFRSHRDYGYDTVCHNYPEVGKCLSAKWVVTDENQLDLQLSYEEDLDKIDLVVTPTQCPTVWSTASPKSKTQTTSKPGKKSGDAKKLKDGTVSGSYDKTVWKAPTFTLKRKKMSGGQRYILLKLHKYKGTHVEVWVKIGTGRYKKIKLSQNKVKKLHGKLKFRYSFTRKTLYFKLRTYQKKKSKTSYSVKSKAKRIVAK